MNIEVEVKVRIKDFNQAKSVLEKIGEHRKTVRQVDTYFSPPHKDFFAVVPPAEFFRIRVQPDKAEMTYHRNTNWGKEDEHAQEYEVGITEVENMMKILEHLEFKKKFVIDKTREYWHCGDFEVVLDDVKDLGPFLEVEVVFSTDEVAVTKDDCLQFLKDNNIEYIEYINLSYPEIMMQK